MIRPLRIVYLFLLLINFTYLASCNRNECEYPPCEVTYSAQCAPCPPCPSMVECTAAHSYSLPECPVFFESELQTLPNYSVCHFVNPEMYPCLPEPSIISCESCDFNPVSIEKKYCENKRSIKKQGFSERCFSNMRCQEMGDQNTVKIVQYTPEIATVGAPYPIELLVTACKDCADVTVKQCLPCDAEFLYSNPPVNQKPIENQLNWIFPKMSAGEVQKLSIWVRPTKEGCCISTATVSANPQINSLTHCVQPLLCVKECGPESVCLNCPVCYTVEVSNSGSGTAYDVFLVTHLPDELTHASRMKELTYELGDLSPGQSKSINIEACATSRGCANNIACVSYCGGSQCCSEWSTQINEPQLQVTKTGPDWAYICKIVDYTIAVKNCGDITLTDVYVNDTSPPGTVIVSAPGAEVSCNEAVWTIAELCPGETRVFLVSLRSQCAGSLVNRVTASSEPDCGEILSCAEATTCWRGIPNIQMSIGEVCDPLYLGEMISYHVCVTNKGTANDTDIKLFMDFTEELQLISVDGPTQGNIYEHSVAFEPLEYLAPQESVEFCVTVKNIATGSAHIEANLSSDTVVTPISETKVIQIL